MTKKYVVKLSDEERKELTDLIRRGKSAAYRIRHAHILLKVDQEGEGWTDEQVSKCFNCHEKTVYNIRQRFVEQGFDAALERKRRETPPTPRKLDGEGEARLVALACEKSPAGTASWTLSLLADKLVELGIVESLSYETVRRTLKKTNLNLTCVNAG